MLGPNITVLWEKKSRGENCDFVKFAKEIKFKKRGIPQ